VIQYRPGCNSHPGREGKTRQVFWFLVRPDEPSRPYCRGLSYDFRRWYTREKAFEFCQKLNETLAEIGGSGI
jgi:hypothetical protein